MGRTDVTAQSGYLLLASIEYSIKKPDLYVQFRLIRSSIG